MATDATDVSGDPRRLADRDTSLRDKYRRYKQLRFTDPEMAALLLTPVLTYLFLISYYPIIDTIWTSLHQGSVLPTQEETFVGLENYRSVVSSSSFWNAFIVTMIYTFVSVPIEMVIGLGLALLVNRGFKGKYIAQAAILFPWALPTIINARIWSWLFHGEYGVINDMLIRVGILESSYPFLSNPDIALASMLFVTIWKTSSFVALILLAGLASIPENLYEAARIDGASKVKQFWYVTLPLLKPVILVALIFRTLPAFQAFGLPYGLTGGGPGESTTTLVLWAHQITFTRLEFGEGAAAATIITVFAMVICVVYVATLYEPEVR
ncbi:carbohydrate ABC transporter permease [Halalkalicoccus paucihalophilus]|nr:sugar ABC transporter permease [Halalkalicoccus paucihalophilus]